MFDKLKDAVGGVLQGNTDAAEQVDGAVASAGGLDLAGIVNQLGGLDGIMDAVKGIDFPIGMDDLEPILAKAGVSSGIVDQLKDSGVSQIDSADDLVGLAKKFLG